MLLLSLSFPPDFSSSLSQCHSNTSRTDHFQGCSGPAALWARRWVEGTTNIYSSSSSMTQTWIYCTYRQILIHTCTDTYMFKQTCMYTYTNLPHCYLLLLSIICPHSQNMDDTVWLIGCFFMTVALQHFLALFLPNDAARARDIWVSYIASLISAYAKLSFFPLSPCRRFTLYGRHFLHPLSVTALSSYWQTVQSYSACWVCIIACLQERSLLLTQELLLVDQIWL